MSWGTANVLVTILGARGFRRVHDPDEQNAIDRRMRSGADFVGVGTARAIFPSAAMSNLDTVLTLPC
jgi:hypothetical protein